MRISGKTGVALLLGALALGACAEEEKDVVHIGGLFSTTGALAQTGFAQLSAARLAVGQINDAGGVLGKRLVLVYRDDGTDENKTRRAAAALVQEGVPAVIGTVSTGLTRIAADELAPGTVMVSGSASSGALRGFEAGDALFRTCAADDGEGRLLASRALARGLRRAAIIRRSGAAEAGLAEAFAAYFVREGRVVFHEGYQPGQQHYGELLGRLFAAAPDVVLLDADPVDGAELVRGWLDEFPQHRPHWLFSHAVADAAFVSQVGARAFTFSHEGAGPGTPLGRRYTDFAEAWEARYGASPTMGTFAANVYDAVFLVALAIEQAGAADPAGVREALPRVSTGGRAFGPDEYREAVAALAAGEDINYEGASGSVDLDATTGETTAPYDVWMVQDGELVAIERALIAPR